MARYGGWRGHRCFFKVELTLSVSRKALAHCVTPDIGLIRLYEQASELQQFLFFYCHDFISLFNMCVGEQLNVMLGSMIVVLGNILAF